LTLDLSRQSKPPSKLSSFSKNESDDSIDEASSDEETKKGQ
jgi:hypothetical protein